MAEAWGPKVEQLLMEALALIFAGAFVDFVGFKWFQVVLCREHLESL